MSVKSVFANILGACIGLIFGALVAVKLKMEGFVIALPLAIGLLIGRFIFTRLIGKKVAKEIYEQTEEAVHGNPTKTILLWLLMFIILAAGLIIFGSMFF